LELLLRKRKRPRRRTGSRRVRERFEAVEIPLKSTNQSQNARQPVLVLLPIFDLLDTGKGKKVQGIERKCCHRRGFVPELVGVFFVGLETPKLIKKKRRPLRRELSRFMSFL
jgi:hypothetical protein